VDGTDIRKALRDVSQSQFTEYLEIVKNVADLINIVSWLPEGFLWAGKVSRAKNGFLGTVSSLISLNTVIQGHLKARSSTP
jgi:peroxin-11C